MNILLVEDDQTLRKVLSHFLLDRGHTVTAAANGQEAIKAVEGRSDIHLIICDILMPVTSGPALILMLQKHFKQKFPKLVIISGVKEGEDFVKSLQISYDYFLPKPLNFLRLENLLSKIDPYL